jgi:hypothetical protein
MITAVDTNILLDIFLDDPQFSEKSSEMLRRCIREGKVIACDIVWAETAANFKSEEEFKKVMDSLEIEFSPLDASASFHAGHLWKSYREKNPGKSKIVADFLIAAHANSHAERLLSRDRGFYRGYFKNLVVLNPE